MSEQQPDLRYAGRWWARFVFFLALLALLGFAWPGASMAGELPLSDPPSLPEVEVDAEEECEGGACVGLQEVADLLDDDDEEDEDEGEGDEDDKGKEDDEDEDEEDEEGEEDEEDDEDDEDEGQGRGRGGGGGGPPGDPGPPEEPGPPEDPPGQGGEDDPEDKEKKPPPPSEAEAPPEHVSGSAEPSATPAPVQPATAPTTTTTTTPVTTSTTVQSPKVEGSSTASPPASSTTAVMPVDPVEAVPAAPAAAPPAPPVEETLTASAAPVPAAVKSAAPNGGLQAFTFGAVSPSPFRRPAAPVLWWEEMMASVWEGSAAQWYGLPLEWQAAIAGGGIIVSLLALSRLLRSLGRAVPALLRRRSGSV